MNFAQDQVRGGQLPSTGPVKIAKQANGRRERRFPMEGTIQIGWIGASREVSYLSTRARDISSEGFGVWSAEPLPVGAWLHADLGGCGMGAVARVRWCEPDADGFRIGCVMLKSFATDAADFPHFPRE